MTSSVAEPKQQSKHSQHCSLHGADDLMSLFNLHPLWERSVRPYSSSRNKFKPKSPPNDLFHQGEGQDIKPQMMEKTYLNYIRDLPGKVRPAKRALARVNHAASRASLPKELTGQTTMHDIVFRPETTLQRVGPFDDQSLRQAFSVEAGPLEGVDLSLLDAEDFDQQAYSKKKRKRSDKIRPKSEDGVTKKAKLRGNALQPHP